MAGYNDGYAYQDSPLLRLQKILNWALYVGKPFGIPTRIHWSTLIIPLLIAWRYPTGDWGDWGAVFATYAIVIYGSIYLHELGHAITAIQLRYPVREIFLYFLGGVAISMGQRRTPRDDFAIIAFGPMVNFVLVAIAAGLRLLFLDAFGMRIENGWYAGTPYLSIHFFLEAMFYTNLALGIFNLIPIFPLDGGGMTRALFSLKYNPQNVTVRVARFGQWVVAPLMILAGIAPVFWPGGRIELILVFIAILAIQACEHEKRRARYMPIYEGDPLVGGFGGASSVGGYNAWASNDEPGWGKLSGIAADSWSAEADQNPKKEGYFARRKREREEQKARRAREAAAEQQLKMDEILDKISREGIGSLTDKEKKFMQDASKRK